ncbi:hypothetical protein K3495_g7054 [Podosphaera aphanis]|nr:hypothetical protein K3495_g7054 [Podosphaera aphanis]
MAYPVSYIQIGQEFVEILKAAYLKDKQCSKLLEILNANDDEGINAETLPFEFHNGLLYAKPDQIHHKRRPVIPNSLVDRIFHYAHDQLGHLDYDRQGP